MRIMDLSTDEYRALYDDIENATERGKAMGYYSDMSRYDDHDNDSRDNPVNRCHHDNPCDTCAKCMAEADAYTDAQATYTLPITWVEYLYDPSETAMHHPTTRAEADMWLRLECQARGWANLVVRSWDEAPYGRTRVTFDIKRS